MVLKRLLFVHLFLFFVFPTFAQKIDLGNFNDWDFGPERIIGNLPIKNIKERRYYKIEKIGKDLVKTSELNPSNVVIGWVTVLFQNGKLNQVKDYNQWGQAFRIRNFKSLDSNEFEVKELENGENPYIPAKTAHYVYKNGLLKEIRFYGFDGKLVNNKDGVAITRYERYEDKIRFAETRRTEFFNVKYEPIISKFVGYHGLERVVDLNDNPIEINYLDLDNKLFLFKRLGIAGTKTTYNENNAPIQFINIGLKSEPLENVNGLAISKWEYKNGYPVHMQRYDAKGNPMIKNDIGDGISLIIDEYDLFGNRVKIDYFNDKGAPSSDHGGIHEIRRKFNENNMLISVRYYNEKKEPCLNRDSIHEIRFWRDSLGRVRQAGNYNTQGEGVKDYTDEVFMIKKTYDDFSRLKSESYWEDSVTRMPRWDGTFERIIEYTKDGQFSKATSLNSYGEASPKKDGSSEIQLIYNPDGSVLERRFLDKNKLINTKDGVSYGYSTIRYSYDNFGKVLELSFFDNISNPVNATVWIHDSVSASKLKFIYIGNRVIKQEYFHIGDIIPYQTVDCLKEDYLAPSGMNIGRKNVSN